MSEFYHCSQSEIYALGQPQYQIPLTTDFPLRDPWLFFIAGFLCRFKVES